jgi:hypothetical protein
MQLYSCSLNYQCALSNHKVKEQEFHQFQFFLNFVIEYLFSRLVFDLDEFVSANKLNNLEIQFYIIPPFLFIPMNIWIINPFSLNIVPFSYCILKKLVNFSLSELSIHYFKVLNEVFF